MLQSVVLVLGCCLSLDRFWFSLWWEGQWVTPVYWCTHEQYTGKEQTAVCLSQQHCSCCFSHQLLIIWELLMILCKQGLECVCLDHSHFLLCMWCINIFVFLHTVYQSTHKHIHVIDEIIYTKIKKNSDTRILVIYMLFLHSLCVWIPKKGQIGFQHDWIWLDGFMIITVLISANPDQERLTEGEWVKKMKMERKGAELLWRGAMGRERLRHIGRERERLQQCIMYVFACQLFLGHTHPACSAWQKPTQTLVPPADSTLSVDSC